jgi:hypothetical protein
MLKIRRKKKMTRFDSKVTEAIIRKVHILLSDIKSGEQIIDFLRATEPIFMHEVGRFVQIELDKMRRELGSLNEETLMRLGSIIGAAYLMGFLICRELDHRLYKGVIDFDSLVANALDIGDIDAIIDKNLAKGKKPKEIGEIISRYFSKRNGLKDTKKPRRKFKKRKTREIDVEFDEGDL